VGSGTFRLVCKKKAQVVAAIYSQDLSRMDAAGAGGSAGGAGRGDESQSGAAGGAAEGTNVRRTSSDPTVGQAASSSGARAGSLPRSKTLSYGKGSQHPEN
jgi:hypothetical protein